MLLHVEVHVAHGHAEQPPRRGVVPGPAAELGQVAGDVVAVHVRSEVIEN